jgi:HAD superfamily phosphoserine phosphatase-like hydrolase
MKIAFLDLEGTLTKEECWSKIKDKFGAGEFLEEYEKLYTEGKIGYEEWRRKLVEAWAGKVTKHQFIDELKDYELIEGAKALIDGLKEKGFEVIIITGGPDIFAEIVSEVLGIDEYYAANEFLFDEKGFFVDIKTHEKYRRGEGKVKFIKEIVSKKGANEDECIAIGGDDINDYWMLKEFKSFAVNPHLRQIQEVVDHNVNSLIEILKFV